MKSKLSVVTCCNDAISMEFYLEELIKSIWSIADEIVVVNGDNSCRETVDVCKKVVRDMGFDWYIGDGGNLRPLPDGKFCLYFNKWEPRMGWQMLYLQKNIAISHATGDWVLRLDADELIHEDDLEKIRGAIDYAENNDLYINAFTFKVLHFWGDYDHIKTGKNESDPGENWYERRVHLFRNNLRYHDGHDKHGNDTDSLVDGKYNPVLHLPTTANTSIRCFHYGHVRSKEVYLNKKNKIERMFHGGNWQDLTEWKWDMTGTVEYEGTHPKVMENRISIMGEKKTP